VVVRRLVIILTLVAVLAIGGVLGLSKMGIDVLPPHQMRQIHAFAAYSGAKARRVKGYIVGKIEASPKEAGAHPETSKIFVTSATVQDVIITESFVCQIRSQRHIEVRALEGGYLSKIGVREGQAVKEGYVMFKILPVLYAAKLSAEVAEAELARLKWMQTKK